MTVGTHSACILRALESLRKGLPAGAGCASGFMITQGPKITSLSLSIYLVQTNARAQECGSAVLSFDGAASEQWIGHRTSIWGRHVADLALRPLSVQLYEYVIHTAN